MTVTKSRALWSSRNPINNSHSKNS